MNIQTYTFKSPYPNQIQMGEAVDQPKESKSSQTAQKEEEQSAQNTTQNLDLESVLPQKSVPNIANTVADTSLNSSLSEFSRLSSGLQAAQAYAN
jgi:hypothetical protein